MFAVWLISWILISFMLPKLSALIYGGPGSKVKNYHVLAAFFLGGIPVVSTVALVFVSVIWMVLGIAFIMEVISDNDLVSEWLHKPFWSKKK